MKKLFSVRLVRRTVEYRVVTVEAGDAAGARRRALALARGSCEPRPVEDEGGWCDGAAGRARVLEVEEESGSG